MVCSPSAATGMRPTKCPATASATERIPASVFDSIDIHLPNFLSLCIN